MRVYVAAVSGERQYVQSVLSFSDLIKGKEDTGSVEYNLRGNVARTIHAERFLADKTRDAMFMVDMDMAWPPDALERLRTHNLDIVGGHYYGRQIWPDPVFSIVRGLSSDGQWPYPILRNIPKHGLHEVAMLGMGCVLISRKAMEAVAVTLPPNSSPVAERPMPVHSAGSHHVWGSDFAFFTLARDLGFRAYLDADVRCSHACTVYLDDALYEILEPHNDYSGYYRGLYGQTKEVFGMTGPRTIQARIEQVRDIMNKAAKLGMEKKKQVEVLQQEIAQLRKEYDAGAVRIDELESWLGQKAEPQIASIANLPRFTPEEVDAEMEKRTEKIPPEKAEEIRQQREVVYAREALAHIEALDSRKNASPPPDPA